MSKLAKTVSSVFVVSLLMVSFTNYPAIPALQPYHFIGKVESISEETITVETKERIDSGKDIDWDDTSGPLEGKVPNQNAPKELSAGNWVEIGSLGSPEDIVVIAKVSSYSDAVITDLFGDPRFLQDPGLPWRTGYSITYENQPDCSECESSTCRAESTLLSIDGTNEQKEIQMKPGEEYMTKSLTVRFHSGEAPASSCSEQAAVGPQPVSNFTIKLFNPENWAKDKPDTDQVTFEVFTLENSNYAIVKLQFGAAGFCVDWGDIEQEGSVYVINCKVYSYKGIVPQVVPPPVSRTYKLEGATTGQYALELEVWDEKIAERTFNAPAPIEWGRLGITPNPVTTEEAQLDLRELSIPLDSIIPKVFDMAGSEVFSENFSTKNATLSLPGISNGIYLYYLVIRYEGRSVKSPIKKLCIMR